MKMTQRTYGLSVLAAAAVLFASASFADGARGLMAADADKDGKITQTEFDTWKGARAPVDADKDGKLSLDELVAMQMAGAEARAKTMAEHMIATKDADGDGKLSAEDLVAPPVPDFAKLDANGDGTVTAEELAAARGKGDGPGMGGHERGQERGGHGRHGKMPMPGDAPEAAPDGN
jgi:hypothetical protein